MQKIVMFMSNAVISIDHRKTGGLYTLFFEHFKQPTPLGQFDNVTKSSKVIYIPNLMLPLTYYEV